MTRREWFGVCAGATCATALQAAGEDCFPFQYLTLEMVSGRMIGEWNTDGPPIPFGSLLKPFLVLAYARTHSTFPTVTCRGAASNCWWPTGHGSMSIVPAIAHSCNAYFLALAADLDRAALASVCQEYGLSEPASAVTPAGLIGLQPGWPQHPVEVIRAYKRVMQNRSEKSVRLVLNGMRRCAQDGTAKGLRINSAYAKTGTAPCVHKPCLDKTVGLGDGYVVVAYPDDVPRLILLAQQHNTTGAHTAELAGSVLRREYRAVAPYPWPQPVWQERRK